MQLDWELWEDQEDRRPLRGGDGYYVWVVCIGLTTCIIHLQRLAPSHLKLVPLNAGSRSFPNVC